MSSVASSYHGFPRARASASVLLVALVLAPLGATRSQDTSTAARRRTQDGPAAKAETTFMQRLAAQLLKDLADRRVRDSLRRDSIGRQEPQVRMPDVVGMDTSRALRTLRAVALRGRIGAMSYTIVPPSGAAIPVDKIVEQLPAAGTLIRAGASARFTLGGVPRPPDSVTVPRVIGLLETEATATLRATRLVTERLEQPVTAPGRIGRVTLQKPDSGERLAAGGSVSVWIGQDARVFMPDVTGVAPAVARVRLRELDIGEDRIEWDTIEASTSIDSVVRQRPAAGTVVLPTTRIVLTQAVRPPPVVGEPTVVVPMVVGRDTATAIGMLGAAGLRNYRILLPVDTTADDSVRTQAPEAGRRVRANSLIVLTLHARTPVTADPPPIVPPPRRDWLRWLAAAGLLLAIAGASALGARAIWPPPKIVPRLRIQPAFAEVMDAGGSLVEVSVSLRSRVEHERSALDLTGSSLV